MSEAVADGSHPVLACLRELNTALDVVERVEPVFMRVADQQAALVGLAAAEARLAELKLRVLAAADGVGEESGARDSAEWLAAQVRSDPRATRADRHLAKALDRWPQVAAGMRTGAVNAGQARAVVAGLENLPADLEPAVVADAETTLVGYCATFGPRELRRLASRLLEVVAPDIAEAEEGKRLEAEERRACETMSLRFKDQGDGTSRFWGRIPTPLRKRWEHYLQAYTNPRRSDLIDGPADGPRVPQHLAYAEAFATLLEHLDPRHLPVHGGDATTVVVTMTIEQLRADLATAGILAADAETDTISAEQARRLACQATIVPMVLGGKGEILDLGRSRRLFSRAQNKAMRVRDRGCRAEGCTIPANWCEGHHLDAWARGGATDLANAVCLCAHHHHRIHDRAYRHERLANGDIRFHRRR